MSIRVRHHAGWTNDGDYLNIQEWMPVRPPVAGLLHERRIILMNYKMVPT